MNFNEARLVNEDIIEEGLPNKVRAAIIGAATLIAASTGLTAKKAWDKAYKDYMNSRTDYYDLYKSETSRVSKKAWDKAYDLYANTRLPNEDLNKFILRNPPSGEIAKSILDKDVNEVQANLDKFKDEQKAKHPFVSKVKPYNSLDIKNRYSYEADMFKYNVENGAFAGSIAGSSTHKDAYNHGDEEKFKESREKYTYPKDINGKVYGGIFNKRIDAKNSKKLINDCMKFLNKVGAKEKPYGISAAVAARQLRDEIYSNKDGRVKQDIYNFIKKYNLNDDFDNYKFAKEADKLLENIKTGASYEPGMPNSYYK